MIKSNNITESYNQFLKIHKSCFSQCLCIYIYISHFLHEILSFVRLQYPQCLRASFSAYEKDHVISQCLCIYRERPMLKSYLIDKREKLYLPLWRLCRRPQDHIGQCTSQRTFLRQGSSSEEPSSGLADDSSWLESQLWHTSSPDSRKYTRPRWRWGAPATCRTQASCKARKEACTFFQCCYVNLSPQFH